MEKIDLEKILQYPLTFVPLSLAHTNESLNKTDKSKLLHKLEDQILDYNFSLTVDVVIADATFLMHLQHNILLTFGSIARVLLQQLYSIAQQVHFVCDTCTERCKRGAQKIVFNTSDPDQVRPKEWRNALKSCSFKTSFYRYLATEWSKDSYADLIKDHQIYFALDNICYHFTLTLTLGGCR